MTTHARCFKGTPPSYPPPCTHAVRQPPDPSTQPLPPVSRGDRGQLSPFSPSSLRSIPRRTLALRSLTAPSRSTAGSPPSEHRPPPARTPLTLTGLWCRFPRVWSSPSRLLNLSRVVVLSVQAEPLSRDVCVRACVCVRVRVQWLYKICDTSAHRFGARPCSQSALRAPPVASCPSSFSQWADE